jgi:uncharacterized protein (DUF1697 family)
MGRYVALLRGINVGGVNPIPMAELRACFLDAGLEEVATYIQSGNVVFSSSERNAAVLTERIERMLSGTFAYEASVVLRSRAQMRAVVERAPAGFGCETERYRSDVLFLKPPLTARAAIREVTTREGVDRAWEGPGVLYFDRLTERASQSRLTRIVSLPIYKQLTIRNWNTTSRLLAMLEE